MYIDATDKKAAAWTDEVLLACSQEEPEYFVFLVRRYEAPFARKARRILRHEEDVEDVVQEAFTKIYLKAHTFSPRAGASFSSWAYRVLINTALTKYRKLMRDAERVTQLPAEYLELLHDDAHEGSFRLELGDYVCSVLARMPETLSRALTLHFIDGLSQQEIATREAVSLGAIKTRVHRAKHLFRALAQEYQ